MQKYTIPVLPNTFSYAQSKDDLFRDTSLILNIMSNDDPSAFRPSSLHIFLIAVTLKEYILNTRLINVNIVSQNTSVPVFVFSFRKRG